MERRAWRTAVLAVLCFSAWQAIARDLSPLSLAGSAAMAAAAALLSARVFEAVNPAEAARPFVRLDLLAWFGVEMAAHSYLAAAELAGRILTGRYHPGTVRIRTRLRSRLGRVVLANAITLVPGTLSVWLRDRHIYVHWFTVKTRHSVRAGRLIKDRLERVLAKVFG